MSKTWPIPRRTEAAVVGAFIGSLALTLLAATAAPAQQATIKGEIILPGRGLETASRLTDTVVQVSAEPTTSNGRALRPAEGVRVEIRHHELAPRVVAIPAGSAVEFVNRDARIHNLVSSSPAKKFDLGMTAPGESGRVLFEQPGSVRVICKAESGMEAFVVVTATNDFAVADARGRYEIRGLAAGSYVLEAWNPHYGTVREPISIPRDGDVVTENVEFRNDG